MIGQYLRFPGIFRMVAAGPVLPIATGFATTSGGKSSTASDSSRIKAEILSARSEKQCSNCEGDKEKLDQKIRELEGQLRRVQATERTSPPSEANNNKPIENKPTDAKPTETKPIEATATDPSRTGVGTAARPPNAETYGPDGARNPTGDISPGQQVDVTA